MLRCVAAFVLASSAVAAIDALPLQQPTFRSGVDLVAVDVQVVDRDGQPVQGLTAENFQVTIQGRPRQVASADLLRFDPSRSAVSEASDTLTPTSTAPRPRTAAADRRIFIIAVDTMSFTPASVRIVAQSAQAFVESLRATDLVGLVPFPLDATIDLTTDHGAVIAALDKVVGTRASTVGDCRLNPSDIIDFTDPRLAVPGARPDPLTARRIAEVAATAGPTCRPVQEAAMLALMEEAEIAQRLQSLRSLLQALGAYPERKTVVLVSTGIITADRTGGRPDIGLDVGHIVGQDAARANTTIYSLWVDNLRRDASMASTRGLPRTTDNHQRDAMLVSAPLDRITASSGGAMFNVVQGGGEFAFDRVLRETSAHYLLGVEPEDADRDGEPRALAVRVNRLPPGAFVRSRSWVVVEPRATAAAAARSVQPSPADPDAATPRPSPIAPGPDPPAAAPAPPPPPVIAGAAAEPSSPADATLVPVLAAAGSYVDRFTTAFANVVADERYVQDVLSGGTLLSGGSSGPGGPSHRVLRSDLLILRTAGPLGWQTFRDVFEVDGAAVRDREERLTGLFERPSADALAQAARIARESARYNIGAVERTVNTPVLALLLLQPEVQPRFEFSRAPRTPGFADTVDVVAFRESSRPTIVRTVQDADRPASGRVWVDRETGAVLQTELVLTGVGVSVRFTTLFRHDPDMNVAVPARMEEEYTLASGRLVGIATYDRFRRFTVSTDSTVGLPSGRRP